MRHPDGSPAAGVPVMIDVPRFTKESRQYRTNQEGAVVHEINTYDAAEITVEVSIQEQLTERSNLLYLSVNYVPLVSYRCPQMACNRVKQLLKLHLPVAATFT